MLRTLILFLFVCCSYFSNAQILPIDSSKLNYRLVGFSVPLDKQANTYTFEISKGNQTHPDSFRKYTFLREQTTMSSKMIEVPQFGEDYSWRVVYAGVGIKKKESPIYHFSTLANGRVDTARYRLRIMKPSKAYKDMYISIDGGGVIYDLSGNAMAYIPEVNDLGGFVADLDFTADSTLTHNYIRSVYEFNLNGDIIWRSPEHTTVNTGVGPEIFHHAVTKLRSGHYMTLGMEHLPSKLIVRSDTSYIDFSRTQPMAEGYKKGIYGTIVEFDKNGKVVWSWKDIDHLTRKDLAYFAATADSNYNFDPHSNSFFFDEENGFVYLSYRNLSRIIKIDYRTSEIVAIYGENFKPGATSYGRGYFCNPHGVRRSANGEIYYFNNNSCRVTDSLPSVVILSEPQRAGDSLKKVWEYICTVEGDYPKKFGAGGSAIELPDHSMLVCMGNAYSKIFIVTRDKNVTWSALPEMHIETDNIWANVKQYRANVIYRDKLEKLIWKAEISMKR